jgi:pyruvate/2-oxoglutarate dehydrogenase complex dihydrolipoamide acyltransferase (E2) component
MSTFRLPDLGEGLAEAEILEWHVKPGDPVLVDQPMLSAETAKAVVEVPVPYSGTITALHGAVGDIIATGAPLIEFDSGTVVGSMPAVSEGEFVEAAVIGRSRANGAARNRAVPMARALAKRLGIDLENLAGSGPGGVIKLDDVLEHAQMAAPAASQIDGSAMDGRGSNGRAITVPAGAVAGAGKVRPEPVVVGDTLKAHRRMPLSLSFDHRCITGGEACRFLAAAIGDLERPD